MLQGKRHGLLDFVASGFMCLGLVLFTLADSKVGLNMTELHCTALQLSPSFNLTGVLMICLALVADAVIGNVQEKTIRQFGATNSEVNSFEPTSHLTGPLQVVLYSYSIGFVYLFFLVAVFTDIASAIHYCSYYPKASFTNIK